MRLDPVRFFIAVPLTFALTPLLGQPSDAASLLHRIDYGAQSRYNNVLGFTVTEHYSVFRGDDETHPAAEMTVKTTYRKDQGKTYAILSQTGSPLILRLGLHALLANEESINKPGNIEHSWFTTANYDMQPEPARKQKIDGHDCVAVKVTPRHKAPSAIEGTLWVDAKDGALVETEGLASRKPSPFAGPTHMMRLYKSMDGYAMATVSRAESDSRLFGRTVVTIDCSNYQLQLRRDGAGQQASATRTPTR